MNHRRVFLTCEREIKKGCCRLLPNTSPTDSPRLKTREPCEGGRSKRHWDTIGSAGNECISQEIWYEPACSGCAEYAMLCPKWRFALQSVLPIRPEWRIRIERLLRQEQPVPLSHHTGFRTCSKRPSTHQVPRRTHQPCSSHPNFLRITSTHYARSGIIRWQFPSPTEDLQPIHIQRRAMRANSLVLTGGRCFARPSRFPRTSPRDPSVVRRRTDGCDLRSVPNPSQAFWKDGSTLLFNERKKRSLPRGLPLLQPIEDLRRPDP